MLLTFFVFPACRYFNSLTQNTRISETADFLVKTLKNHRIAKAVYLLWFDFNLEQSLKSAAGKSISIFVRVLTSSVRSWLIHLRSGT